MNKTNKKDVSAHTYAVILAGGVGSRFWPLSRELESKQFLKLHGDKSLLQYTISRIHPLIPAKRIYIIGNCRHRYEIEKQIAPYRIPPGNVILEPQGKNTAPAIAAAAEKLARLDAQSTMIVLPADHFIHREQKFLEVLKGAVALADNGFLVTLGITPTLPHTGYGYIKIKSLLERSNERTKRRGDVRFAMTRGKGPRNQNVFLAEKFVEKPDRKKAEQYFKDKKYYWNSGMFVWKSKVILAEIKEHLPGLARRIIRVLNRGGEIDPEQWSRIQAISIDYGVLERSRNVAIITAGDIGWSDLGSWASLHEVFEPDENGNIIKADSIDIESRNMTVFGSNRLIATIGLKDTVVVDTDDALLVCKKEHAEKVKHIVDMIKGKGRKEHSLHKTVKRPWGTYTVLSLGEGFKIKLIQIDPHKRLSMQKHNYRSEHWVVVEGRATVACEGRILYPRENESVYIQKGHLHRLENPSETPLKIVEVQCGGYLEEDDIERFDDDYKR